MTIANPSNEPLLESSRFTILRQLGAGAFGIVYEAEDNRRKTRVALKLLRNLDGHSLYSFKREFRSLAEFTHPNLIRLHELFSENGQWFFTMDLVDGTDFVSFIRSLPLSEQQSHALPQGALTKTVDTVDKTPLLDTVSEEDPSAPWVDEKKRLPHAKTGHAPKRKQQVEAPRWTRLRSVLGQLAQGLCALHAAGKLHRDLKPSNVLVTHAGQLVIVDFGLATDVTPNTQRSAERVAGTPAYMAPEQAMGEKAAPASDWYAVGIMLYEALTGRLPFQGNPEQILFSKQVEDPIPPTQIVRGIPADLAALALDLMKRSPNARPSGLDVLRHVMGTLPEPIGREPLVEHLGLRVACGALRPKPLAPSAFVGREEHLVALRDAFDWVRAGQAMTVHVRGKSGMGKTALVRHFLEVLALEHDVVILAGRCHEREVVPYKGIDSLIDALSRYLARLPKNEAQALLPPDVHALAQLFPVLERVAILAEKIRRLPLLADSAELRQRAFAALRELFVRIAQIKPLVLHLDDLQWGDADSAALLRYLLDGPQPPVLLLLLSYRSDDAERSEMLQNMPAPNLLTTTQKNAAAIQDIFVGPLPELDAFSAAPDDLDALAFQPTVNSDPPSAILQKNEREMEQSHVEPGTVIKHYEIIRKLGVGGMGAVYLARDTRLGRLVAIKFLLDYSGSAAQRFLLEARVTASCRHENIVVIYDVDEFNGHPYMVLEYIEGRTLRDSLREITHDPRTRNESRRETTALEMIVPVVRALVCAHEAHIVHRDLKPENILLANSGEVRVVDFGIAKQVSLDLHHPARASRPDSTQHDVRMTQTGARVGTLAYMAPEQWLLDANIDARIDIWSVGIILFELVVGEHPLAPLTPQGLASVAQLDKPMPRVRDKQPGAGPIADIIDRCLAKRKEERFASTKELLAALEAIGHDERKTVESSNEDDAPFTGLSAFQEADAPRFFGRENDIAALMSRLRHQELITITGASGAGKSSFVRAGIIPAFKRSAGSAEALVVRPGLRPLAALADLLGSLTQTDPARPSIHDVDDIAALLRSRPGAFGAQLRARCRERGETHRILLFVDQLEELYTLGISPKDRKAFHACLCGAADDASSPLRVVLAVRADFLDRMSEDRPFMSAATRGLVFLSPIGHDNLRDALEKPVSTTKYRFEDESLVNEMLDALAGSKSPLPLLQFTATKLWEARDRDKRLLTWASYRALGGVVGALSTHADAVLAGMSSREQQLARLIIVRLVTPERTRAIVPWEELCAIAADREAVALVIERLSNARILAIETSGDAAERLVELLHESLIDRWAKLGQWLDENAQDAQFLAELRQAAQQWEKNDKAEGFLWRDRAAIKLSVWFDGHKTADHIGLGTREMEYSHAVIAYAQKTRRRRRAAVIGFLVAITTTAIVFSVLALLARNKAEEAELERTKAKQERNKAEEARDEANKKAVEAKENAVRANDDRLMAGARELRNRGQFTTGLQLLRLVKRPESARGWITLANEALALNALEVTLRGGDKPFSMAAWSPDGKRIAAASRDGKIWIWKADGTGAPDSFQVREKPIHSIDFYPDGEHMLLVSGNGQAHRVGLDGRQEMVNPGTSVESARFVPNKPWMVMTMKDGSVRIHDLSGKDLPKLIVLKAGTTKLHDATPSADGSAIVTRADDNRVRVWQRSGNTWRAIVHRDQGSKVLHAALSPDGRRVVTASKTDTVHVGPADGKAEATVLRVDGDTIGQAFFSADGRYVFGRSHERNLLYVWPAAGGAPLVVAGAHDGPISWAVWGPDGPRALSVSGTVVKVWRFSTLEALPRSRRPRLYLAAIEADGEHAVAAFDDYTVRRFELDAADAADEVSHEKSWIIGLATSPRGNRSLIALLDGRVRIEEGSGADKKTLNLSYSAGSVWGGAFAPDGERVVTCAEDKSVRIWSRETDEWKKLIDLSGHTDLATGAAWSPDSKRLVTSSADGTARVWDVLSGNQIALFKHDGPVFAVAWSPDGQQIATSSLKNGLRVWDASGQGEPIEFAVGSPLIALGFTGGGRIVGVSEDGATHQFLVDVKKLSLALEQSNRDCLSPEQRQTYLIESKKDAEQGYADCERRQLRTPTLLNPQSVGDQEKAPLSGQRWSLVVSPVEATVEVQGVRVPRRGGLIDLVGKQGDELRIRVSLGATMIEKTVVLQKGKLSPSKIDFFEAIAVREKPHEPPVRFETDK